MSKADPDNARLDAFATALPSPALPCPMRPPVPLIAIKDRSVQGLRAIAG